MASFGVFQLNRFLGSGSYGVVWEVRDENGRDCALKVILNSGNEKQQRELDISTGLTHENLVKVYGTSRRDGVSPAELRDLLQGGDCHTLMYAMFRNPTLDIFCMTLELCGENLRKWLDQGPDHNPDSESTKTVQLAIVKNIIEGLKYLHEKKIIHRDLKPANIMFSSKGYILPVKIGDYGTCRIINDPQTSTLTSWVGTDLYLSPEARSNEYNFQSDLFSLGLLLWEVLQLIPFSNLRSYFDSLVHKSHGLVQLNPPFMAWKNNIFRLCEKNVTQRLRSIHEISETIMAVLNCVELEEVFRNCKDGWTIQLMKGEYFIEDIIRIENHNITLKGMGDKTVLRTLKCTVIKVFGRNFTASDFRLEYRESNRYLGIDARGENALFESLSFSGFSTGISAGNNTEIRNVSFQDVYYPILVRRSDCKLSNVTINDCVSGLIISSCSNVTIESLRIENPTNYGVKIEEGVTAFQLTDAKITSSRKRLSDRHFVGVGIRNCPKAVFEFRKVTCRGFEEDGEWGLSLDKESRTCSIIESEDCSLGKVDGTFNELDSDEMESDSD